MSLKLYKIKEILCTHKIIYLLSLDKNDFECLAVRNTVIEGRGVWDEAKYKENSEIMARLWNEIADLADFDKVRRLIYQYIITYLYNCRRCNIKRTARCIDRNDN